MTTCKSTLMVGTYEWDGKTVGGEKVYKGKSCMPLAPDVSSNDESSVFSFDKQLLMDFGVQLQLSDVHEAPISKNESKKRRCKLCKKDIELGYMRLHVAQHILKDNIASLTLCGFCGKSTCSVSLTNTSKKKGVKHYKVQSTCDYNYQFNLKSAEKSSKSHANEYSLIKWCNSNE